jgi:hypothetical protein
MEEAINNENDDDEDLVVEKRYNRLKDKDSDKVADHDF